MRIVYVGLMYCDNGWTHGYRSYDLGKLRKRMERKLRQRLGKRVVWWQTEFADVLERMPLMREHFQGYGIRHSGEWGYASHGGKDAITMNTDRLALNSGWGFRAFITCTIEE